MESGRPLPDMVILENESRGMMSENTADKKSTKTKKTGPATLIIRIVVFGTLGVLLVLALIDNRAKNAAQTSYNNLTDAIDEAGEADLHEADLEKYITGKPTRTKTPLEGSPRAISVVTLKWSGIFREFWIKVYLGLPADNPTINGDDVEYSWATE